MKKLLLLAGACSLFVIPIACRQKLAQAPPDIQLKAYDFEQDPNDPERRIALNYQQAQGKRVFYNNCVWCHADATPAGPSNRINLSPTPPLATDGETLNSLPDEAMQNIITLGGAAMGKSAMMPPWGQTLTQDDIRAVMAFERAIAQTSHESSTAPPPETEK
jgi:cytochrome c oxidase cbb3-type subunit 3